MKQIPLTDNKYFATEDGNIFSMNRQKYLKQSSDKHGYKFVCIKIDGKLRRIAVHRLIAMAYLENTQNKPFINHKNNITGDNSVKNLEWCTPKENNDHCIKQGRHFVCTGERVHTAKLDRKTVELIRIRHQKEQVGAYKLSKMYGVVKSTIQSLLKFKSWK